MEGGAVVAPPLIRYRPRDFDIPASSHAEPPSPSGANFLRHEVRRMAGYRTPVRFSLTLPIIWRSARKSKPLYEIVGIVPPI